MEKCSDLSREGDVMIAMVLAVVFDWYFKSCFADIIIMIKILIQMSFAAKNVSISAPIFRSPRFVPLGDNLNN